MSAFTDFVLSRMVNRPDCHGQYRRGRASTAKDPVTAELIAAHEAGEACIGLHAIGTDGQSRWVCFDLDNHSSDAGIAAANAETVKVLFGLLRDLGAEPVLEDSDGQGGWHVWVFFSEPLPAADAFEWARERCPADAEFFPKQPGTGGRYGNWVRIPGKHPRRNHESRVGDGNGLVAWQEWPWDDFAACPVDIVPKSEKPVAGRTEPLTGVGGKGQPAGGPFRPDGLDEIGRYGDSIRAGMRNNALASLAGAMRRQGFAETSIHAAIIEENRRRCEPPLDDDEVRKIARSIARYAPEPDIELPTGETTEEIMATLNAGLSKGRAVEIMRVVRRETAYEIHTASGTANLRDVSGLIRFDLFAAAVAEACGVMLDVSLRKKWPVIGQMLLDVVEESDAESEEEETRTWLAAAAASNKTADVEEPEDLEKIREHGRIVFFAMDDLRYLVLHAFARWINRSGFARVGAREVAKRIGRMGWEKRRLCFGPRGGQIRLKAWKDPGP